MQSAIKDLSQRQINILKSIIEEYLNTAEPVGSETLDKKYNLGVSPATIRNEMARLTGMNMLLQPHTSSGRTPTPEALKYYVDNLMKSKELSVAEEVSVKEKIWDYRQTYGRMLREATKALAEKTHTLALVATEDGDLYYAGTANILEMPEFFDYELTHNLFATLEKHSFWWDLLLSRDDPFYIVLGEEGGFESLLSKCGFVYMKFEAPRGKGAIGVVGPTRLDYPTVIPTVKYIGDLITELSTNW